MRKLISVFMIFIVYSVFIISTPCPTVMAAGLEALAEMPSRSAILIDYETGRVLWEKNAHEPMAMASTTKIMTAIITLEKGILSDKVIVSAKAAAAPQVKMNLTKGEEISLETLLYALMLQSSNDAAVAIAEHIGGSEEAFCAMMTQKAKGLGAKDTVFETPNGLDKGNHHSTAYDMAIITRYALNNPEFMKIINTRNFNGTSSKTTYAIYNKNRLLDEYEGANGVKTGFTGKAGHCFVGAAKRNDMQLIAVVFASGWGQRGRSQKFVDTKKILNYGFGNYKYETILKSEEPAGEFLVGRSKTESVGLCFADELVLPLTEAEKEEIRIEKDIPDIVKAPVAKGASMGMARVYIGDELVKEISLNTTGSAERFDLKTCAEQVLQAFVKMGTRGSGEVTLPEWEFWEMFE